MRRRDTNIQKVRLFYEVSNMHTHAHIGSWNITESLLVYINCPASVMLVEPVCLGSHFEESFFFYYTVSGFRISNGAVKLYLEKTQCNTEKHKYPKGKVVLRGFKHAYTYTHR